MLLVYYRLYITYTLSGFLFNLDQSNVCRDIRVLEPLVKKCIPLPKKVYSNARRARTIEEVETYFPCFKAFKAFKAFIDASEQEIPRPKNKRRRKSYYSGKKKRHTVKTQYMVNGDGLIIHKSNHNTQEQSSGGKET
ncbi:MAG: transposase family protein [Nitrososphaerales archaeon]